MRRGVIGREHILRGASQPHEPQGRELKVPLLALQLLLMYFRACHDSCFDCLFKRKWFRNKRLAIGVAMLYSVLCCITAARMEEKRLGVVRRHGLVGKPDEVEIPMHVAWLLFQFFLLTGLDSCYRKSVEWFYKDHAPPHLKAILTDDKAKGHREMQRYLDSAVNFVCGLGFLLSVLLVLVVAEWSDGWFQYTLNKSRLDRYYWLLAVLSAVNLLVFEFVVTGY